MSKAIAGFLSMLMGLVWVVGCVMAWKFFGWDGITTVLASVPWFLAFALGGIKLFDV